MLCFTYNPNGKSPGDMSLAGAYVVGSDGVPLRAEIELRDSHLVCAKRADGPAGLALLWPVPGCGVVLLETSRLMDRDTPYNLSLELARCRLMRINQKREDWGLFDFEGVEDIAAEINKSRDLFIEALKADSMEKQNCLAEEALKIAFTASEHLTHFHADIFLVRRKQMHTFSKQLMGCSIDLFNTSDAYRQRIREIADFAYLSIPWRLLEPKQQELDWERFDYWVEWLTANRMPIKVGPLVSFREDHLPDWLSIYETDFEAVRNLIFEHVRRVVGRYEHSVSQWDVVSGLHAENSFNFDIEQLMTLTRVTVLLVKQLAPRAQSVIDLVAPWGEYFARNQRTIPPMLYADMVVQSGVGFDGIGVQFLFGAPTDGMFVRDMFQISEKLDKLGNFGKPLHITAVQVPSAPTGEGMSAGGGSWWEPWSENIQAQWVKEFYAIALSKPFVESICWRDIADSANNSVIPNGGLVHADMKPKLAFNVLKDFRNELLGSLRRPPASRPASPAS